VVKRTWPLLAIAFAVLLAAFLLSGVALHREYRRIYADIERTQQSYQSVERLLDVIRSELYAIAILARDYLLKSTPSLDRQEERELIELRKSLLSHVGELESAVEQSEAFRLHELKEQVDRYSSLINSMFAWTPEEKRVRSYGFLTREIVPFRTTVLKMAAEIDELNTLQFRKRHGAMRDIQSAAEERMVWAFSFVCVFGLLVAGLVVGRTRELEHRSELHHAELQREREELRRLSNKVVSAQEEERKSISRELHDEIGQLLTGLKIELAHLDQARLDSESEFADHMKRARAMAEQTLRAVRDLATGLRPAVLDQLGLEPAIRWQAREHTRLTGVPVTVEVSGELDALHDQHRTCAYRVVQEALTNCARHALPSSITVRVTGGDENLSVVVQDDGRGFSRTSGPHHGLGLLGMEERVA
jgi:signal transduction histidine kinase